ncbi:MAG: sensor domain-containing diguanylate cyclase [Fimbriimonadaceae bacterium]
MAKNLFERPARGLVSAVAALCAVVLALTLVGRVLFDRAMRDNDRDAQSLGLTARLTVDGARVKADAAAVTAAQNPVTFSVAEAQLRSDIRSLQAVHAAVESDSGWHTRRTLATNFNHLVRFGLALAAAPTAKSAAANLPGVIGAANDFDSDMQDGVRAFAAGVNQRMARRLWIFGALLPGAAGFFVMALIAALLPRALARIRRVNATLIKLESASAEQASELKERNTTLHAQKETLRVSQAELIMKTQQLEATSLGSQQAARRFEELFQGLPVACVGFSEEDRVYEWNRASTDTFGYDAYEVLHMKLWAHIANPSFARRGASIVRQVFLGKEFRNVEWEYTRPDGRQRHILGHLFPLRGVDGRILGGVAACLDVTDRKRAEEEVRSSEKLFRDLIDSLHEGVLLYDETGQIVVANKQAGVLLGVPPASMLGRKIEQLRDDFIDGDSQPIQPRQLPYNQCIKSGKAIENACVGFRGRPGRSSDIHWFNVSAIPLYRPDEKHPYGVLTSFSEITDRLEHEDQLKSHVKALAAAHQELKARQDLLERANSQLESLAVTDGLTGLFNHRAFQERLEQEVAPCPENLSLVLIDVDHFKEYNDAFGHPEGDGVLRRVAVMLREAVGDRGVTARYGGEEFAIILPGVNAAAAQDFGDDLCKLVAMSPWPNRSVTISAGVATFGPACPNPAALIRAADEALYGSKRSGRNRSTHADTPRKAA